MFLATNPTVTSSTASSTYNQWWALSINLNIADGVGSGQVMFRKCYADANGLPVFSPVDPPLLMTVAPLMTNADPNVQAAINSLITAIRSQAAIQKLF